MSTRDDSTRWTTETTRPASRQGQEGRRHRGLTPSWRSRPSRQVKTLEPGFQVTIYAAFRGPVPKSVPEGWTKVDGGTVNEKDKRFNLDTRRQRRSATTSSGSRTWRGAGQRARLRDPPVPGSRGLEPFAAGGPPARLPPRGTPARPPGARRPGAPARAPARTTPRAPPAAAPAAPLPGAAGPRAGRAHPPARPPSPPPRALAPPRGPPRATPAVLLLRPVSRGGPARARPHVFPRARSPRPPPLLPPSPPGLPLLGPAPPRAPRGAPRRRLAPFPGPRRAARLAAAPPPPPPARVLPRPRGPRRARGGRASRARAGLPDARGLGRGSRRGWRARPPSRPPAGASSRSVWSRRRRARRSRSRPGTRRGGRLVGGGSAELHALPPVCRGTDAAHPRAAARRPSRTGAGGSWRRPAGGRPLAWSPLGSGGSRTGSAARWRGTRGGDPAPRARRQDASIARSCHARLELDVRPRSARRRAR